MDALPGLAGAHGLTVVEDCAQAHGAASAGRRAGTLGNAAAFSFYPTKNLGALGDGGTVVTDDADRRARAPARKYGERGAVPAGRARHNSRLETSSRPPSLAQAPHLERGERAAAGARGALREGLAGLRSSFPTSAPAALHVYHLYVVRSPARDSFRRRCRRRGIARPCTTRAPVHLQPAYARARTWTAAFPVAESLWRARS